MVGWRRLLLLCTVAAPVSGQAQGRAETGSGLFGADTTWYHAGVHTAIFGDEPRRLEWELYLPAELLAVWQAWTEPDEMAKWAAPGAAVDMRKDGTWEVHFFPDRPPGQRGGDASRIIDFIPGRVLRLAAGAPPEFPTVRAEKTEFTIHFEPAGDGHTRVWITQTGWKQGEEWDRAFETLAHANAEWLSWLKRRFVQGPIDWTQMRFD